MKKIFAKIAAGSFILSSLLFSACRTTDMEKIGNETEGYEKNDPPMSEIDVINDYNDQLIEQAMKNVDIEKTIVYVDRPVYYPVEEKEKKLTGKDAAKKSTADAMQKPEKFVHGTMYYDYDEDFTYEIYCQPFRVTDIQLEPGEQCLEMPFLSEEKVWEIGAGVSRVGAVDTQHFFLKPYSAGLETSFIIITDKRIYHLMLKSFRDTYMTQVKWEYPNAMPFNMMMAESSSSGFAGSLGKVNKITSEGVKIDPRYLSFDYKMSYPLFSKPYWLPYRVYDDGAKTYITMNETVLHMATPVLFNKRNERINYFVEKNLIVINELIEKVTLRIGRKKVVIRKKNYSPKLEDYQAEQVQKETEKRQQKTFTGITQRDMEIWRDRNKVPEVKVIAPQQTGETVITGDSVIIENKSPDSQAQQNK